MVRISELRPGDLVLNGRGEETLARALRIRDYEGDLVTIRPVSPANSFQLTPDHPVLAIKRGEVTVRRKSRRDGWLPEASTSRLSSTPPRYVPAGELRKGDFLVFPISREVRDDPTYTPELLRLLGYYLAEGSVFVHEKLNSPVIEFSLGAKEVGLAEEIKRLIVKVTGREPSIVRDRKKNGLVVVSYSKELMDVCVRSCGKDAATKRLSRDIMLLPPEKQKVLLEAYFKGDGSVYKKGRLMVRASTVSEVLAYQLQELLARQGIFASIYERGGSEDVIDGRRIRRRKQYVIYYSPRKRWRVVRMVDGCFLVPIRSVEKKPFKGKVYNIEVVDASQSYLVKGFVVHNCTAPIYSSESLHSAVVEIIAMKGAYVRYTTLQNWSTDVYNLVTKRAFAYENAVVEWVDANIGSKATMKYPSVYLLGRGARAEILSVAFAGRGQHQDTGAKAVHLAPDTTSRITSKSVCKDGGRTSYRGLLHVAKGAKRVKSSVRCDALILDDRSRTDTYPYNEIHEDDATVTHEATVGKIGEDQIFYLMSRGIPEQDALNMIVLGFLESFTKTLPMEYAIEFNRLIELEMSGSVG
ncbi:MAG: SufD family Fe-S cluster assembly protein [Nitrososphaerota archaeon]